MVKIITVALFCLFGVLCRPCICANHYNKKTTEIKNFHIFNPLFLAENGCDTLIIFDLSSNVTSTQAFAFGIKLFLKSVLKFCNNFKYVSMNQNTNTLKINECDVSNSCENIIDSLNYNDFTSAYSNLLHDVDPIDSDNYLKLLNKMMSTNCSCNNNPVLLLTNRIVRINADSTFNNIIKNSCTKLTTILLGRNEAGADDLLEQEYSKILNARWLNLPNIDCLSYLFYCIQPCSKNSLKCLQADIDDCKVPVNTSNDNPDKTWHLWIVFAFTDRLDNNSYYEIINSLQLGINNFMKVNNVSRIRFRVVSGDHSITISHEDPSTFHEIFIWNVLEHGEVVDDFNEFNNRLNMVPWSGTLTKSRIGIKSILVLTDYATKRLTVSKNNENFSGLIYVYNSKAIEYYSSILKNNSNFSFLLSDAKDPIFFDTIEYVSAPDPIDTITSTSIKFTTTTVITTSTTTTAESHPSSAAFGITYFVMNTYALLFVVCYYAFLVT